MRRYELMLLLRPDLEDDKLQSAVEKVTRAIVNGGGSLSKVSPWGKRRLAYDIKNFRDASYFLIHFDIDPAAVREIERGMLISEEILRHLVTLIEERPGGEEEIQPAAVVQESDDEFGANAAEAPQASAGPELRAEATETEEAEPEAAVAEEPQAEEAVR